jgi:hypothetical protein
VDESDDVDWVRDEEPEEFGGEAGTLDSGTVKPEMILSVLLGQMEKTTIGIQ